MRGVADCIRTDGRPLRAIARDLGVHLRTVQRWRDGASVEPKHWPALHRLYPALEIARDAHSLAIAAAAWVEDREGRVREWRDAVGDCEQRRLYDEIVGFDRPV